MLERWLSLGINFLMGFSFSFSFFSRLPVFVVVTLVENNETPRFCGLLGPLSEIRISLRKRQLKRPKTA
jgi:hypothetical protein